MPKTTKCWKYVSVKNGRYWSYAARNIGPWAREYKLNALTVPPDNGVQSALFCLDAQGVEDNVFRPTTYHSRTGIVEPWKGLALLYGDAVLYEQKTPIHGMAAGFNTPDGIGIIPSRFRMYWERQWMDKTELSSVWVGTVLVSSFIPRQVVSIQHEVERRARALEKT